MAGIVLEWSKPSQDISCLWTRRGLYQRSGPGDNFSDNLWKELLGFACCHLGNLGHRDFGILMSGTKFGEVFTIFFSVSLV